MRAMSILVCVLVGCGGVDAPHVHRVLDPDAGVDAPPPDACHAQPSSDACCAKLPDVDAARACAAAAAPLGSCGDLVCPQPDCSYIEVEYCVAGSDAGVDGGAP
jgi:hypothetical protein